MMVMQDFLRIVGLLAYPTQFGTMKTIQCKLQSGL